MDVLYIHFREPLLFLRHPPPAHQHEVTSNPPISASFAVQTAPDPPPVSEAGDTQPVASQHEEKEGKGERADYSALMEDESNRRGVRTRESVVVRTESQRSAVMEEELVRQRSTAGVGRGARRESATLRSERGGMRGARSGLGKGSNVASAVGHGREAKKRRVEEGGQRVRNGPTKQDQTRTRGGKRGRVVKHLLSRGGRPSEKRSRYATSIAAISSFTLISSFAHVSFPSSLLSPSPSLLLMASGTSIWLGSTAHCGQGRCLAVSSQLLGEGTTHYA